LAVAVEPVPQRELREELVKEVLEVQAQPILVVVVVLGLLVQALMEQPQA